MDFGLKTDGITADMTFEKADSILNNIYLSLMIPRGGFFQNPDFGSRLHLLLRAKNTANTETLAKAYCEEALQWLINTGKAGKIEVFTERDMAENINRLKLLVRVTQTDGQQIEFETFLEVV